MNKPVILGLNFGLHDSSASLVVGGQVVAAAEEERFSREKHTTRFPRHAIEWVVRKGGIELRDVTHVAYYWNTKGRYADRLLHHAGQCLARLHRPARLLRYLGGFYKSRAGVGVSDMLFPERALQQNFPGQWGRFELRTLTHHRCHAGSAFHPSGLADAAVLIIDGSGELESTSLYHGHGTALDLVDRQPLPHSLGFLYGAATEYLGFVRNHDEYKVMGMAAYGTPRHLEAFRRIVTRGAGMRFTLDDDYFDQVYGEPVWYSKKWIETFGAVRGAEQKIEQRHFDLAASVQARVEEIILELARHALVRTGSRNLCLAGGVALNCLANHKAAETLMREGLLDQFYIHPAANDAGASLGAALVLHTELTGMRPVPFASAYLGPSFTDDEMEAALRAASGIRFRRSNALEAELARELMQDKVICRFDGAMEWGPRALGNRSILANPRRVEIREEINVKVKLREEFRPFAPAVLAEDFDTFFEGVPNPYMLLVNRAKPEAAARIPAVVHMDGTARVQVVTEALNPRFHRLLSEFKKLSGSGVLLNTSFNIQEPIVCTPAQAIDTFRRSTMDMLAMGNFLVERQA